MTSNPAPIPLDQERHHAHHCQGHAAGQSTGVLMKVGVLTLLYMLIEVVGGYYSGSLTLLSDAAHMFCDTGAILLALFAAWLAERPHNPNKTYGYYRAEVLAAFVNSLVLIVLAGWILFEAIQRLMGEATHLQPTVAIPVAAGGLIINAISAWLLSSHAQENLNMRGALLHVLSDMLGSVAALTVALIVLFGGSPMWDAAASLIMVGLIVWNAWRLMQQSIHILLEGTPEHLNSEEIRALLLSDEAVLRIHDLHVWSIGQGEDAVSAHVVVKSESDFSPETLKKLHLKLQQQFHLHHTTLQLEPPEFEVDELTHH